MQHRHFFVAGADNILDAEANPKQHWIGGLGQQTELLQLAVGGRLEGHVAALGERERSIVLDLQLLPLAAPVFPISFHRRRHRGLRRTHSLHRSRYCTLRYMDGDAVQPGRQNIVKTEIDRGAGLRRHAQRWITGRSVGSIGRRVVRELRTVEALNRNQIETGDQQIEIGFEHDGRSAGRTSQRDLGAGQNGCRRCVGRQSELQFGDGRSRLGQLQSHQFEELDVILFLGPPVQTDK